MRTFRLLAGILLLISGILHVAAHFQSPDSPGSIPVLSFGVIYMIIGSLLFNGKKYPLYPAIIIRYYPGLKVETNIFPDETHVSCVPAAWMRAFRVLYKKQN